MKSLDIRKKFFEFFKKYNHTHVSSSSLIPAEDPTLLFANAGMNQFKDVFLGKEKRSYTRAMSIQKCMRAGGKHNDLDNVGFTKRHLTFFEMMGNFSFGDYFKKEAIQYAWEFLTQEMNFDSSVMHATVFREDDESYNIWHTVIGLPQERVHRLGEADNFWQMGDTGPCGPCTEIYIDRGPSIGCGKKNCSPGCSCDRFLEVWNLVFMQFDRQPNGTDIPLSQKGVDTGMGLERLCVIMQDVDSVFQTDLFMPIIKQIEMLTGIAYQKQEATIKAAFHVLADHIRASTFLIADGCAPSNEGRGYVLRKIIRRAALFAQKLTEENIFPQLTPVVIEYMADVYPELKLAQKNIVAVLTSEVDKFAANLVQGQNILERYFSEASKKVITGEQAFKLYDTYGFPIELTILIAQERGFIVDTNDFEKQMQEQRERSGKKMKEAVAPTLEGELTTEFTGYQEMETATVITGLVVDNTSIEEAPAGNACWVITAKTPFYVERGGQVSDQGEMMLGHQHIKVEDLKRINNAIAHKITPPKALHVGDEITLRVDKEARLNTMKNHTATHLLQSALIQLFGKQIKQSGSLVHPDYMRFDFTYHTNLTSEEIKQIEDIVNKKIWENIPVQTTLTTYKDAVNKGVIAFFGEKYNPESVRMVQVDDFSSELCGGTHVYRTGDIGIFKITEETALSAGQRRIVALTGPKALEMFQADFDTIKHLSQEFKVKSPEVEQAISKQKEHLKQLQLQLKKVRKEYMRVQLPIWRDKVQEINGIPFWYSLFEEYENEELKDIVTQLQATKPGLYIAVSNQDSRSSFICAISPDYEKKINVQEFSAWLEKTAQLRGGGKKGLLQGGGPKITSALENDIVAWLKENAT